MALDPWLLGLMQRYGFSILRIQTLREHFSHWGGRLGGPLRFDVRGGNRELALWLRRDLRCEICGTQFDYTVRIITEGVLGRAGHPLDLPGLRPVLDRHIRRRVRCPACHRVQHTLRREYLRSEGEQNLVGLVAMAGSVTAGALLIVGGYTLAGLPGLGIGVVLAVVVAIRLTRWMLVHLTERW